MPKPGGGSNRRRSDRISVSLPIHIRGADTNNKRVNEPSRTVEVGRTGTKFSLKAELKPNQKITIGNIRRETEANFRVVERFQGLNPNWFIGGRSAWTHQRISGGSVFRHPRKALKRRGEFCWNAGPVQRRN